MEAAFHAKESGPRGPGGYNLRFREMRLPLPAPANRPPHGKTAARASFPPVLPEWSDGTLLVGDLDLVVVSGPLDVDEARGGGQPPGLGRAHRQAESPDPRGVHLGPAAQVGDGLELVEEHHAPEDLALPQHQLEGVHLASEAVLLVLA